MSKRIYDDCFIVMSAYGIERMTKRKGTLKRGEIAIRVRVTVPESCFAEPDVAATIEVPESAVIKPSVEVAALSSPDDAGRAAEDDQS